MRDKPGVTMATKPKPGAKKPGPSIKQIGIRARAEWVVWLEKGAHFCRTDTSKLIDAALVDYLKARGFDEPPPRRI
jgi:hypothetical protein